MKPAPLEQLDPLTRDLVKAALAWYHAQTQGQASEAEFDLVTACERYAGDVVPLEPAKLEK
ncbi:MAG: hypothetical protein U0822_21185 [Anaerolineae bacterium]